MAYVIIVEFRARPEQVEAFARLIDRHASNSRAEDGCLAFEVCQAPDDPARFVFYEAYRDAAAHRRHLERDSYRQFRAAAPALLVPGPGGALPHQRQVLRRRPYLQTLAFAVTVRGRATLPRNRSALPELAALPCPRVREHDPAVGSLPQQGPRAKPS